MSFYDKISNRYAILFSNRDYPWRITWRGQPFRNRAGLTSWKTEKDARNAFVREMSTSFIWDYVRARGDQPGQSYDTKNEARAFVAVEEASGFLSFHVNR